MASGNEPPVSAHSRSGCSSMDARTQRPSASTTCAAARLSTVSPHALVALGQGYGLARPAPPWAVPAPEAVATCGTAVGEGHFTLLSRFASIERGLVMVQRELGDRWTASPGSHAYGRVSVHVRYHAEAKVVATVFSVGPYWS